MTFLWRLINIKKNSPLICPATMSNASVHLEHLVCHLLLQKGQRYFISQ